jgi:hypothetical protein
LPHDFSQSCSGEQERFRKGCLRIAKGLIELIIEFAKIEMSAICQRIDLIEKRFGKDRDVCDLPKD